MAGTQYLLDSNILLRWVKPDHNDYPLVVSAIDAILRRDDVLCYTSQNVGEFWNTCTRPLDRIGYALSPQETDRRAKFFEEKLRLLPDSLAVHEEWRDCLSRMVCLGFRSTMRARSFGGGILKAGRKSVQIGLKSVISQSKPCTSKARRFRCQETGTPDSR